MDGQGPVGTVMVWPDATFLAPPIPQPIPDQGYVTGNSGDGSIVLEGSVG